MSSDFRESTMYKAFTTPEQMEYWGDANRLVAFLYIQADLHHMASSPQVSKIGNLLNQTADQIMEIINESR